MRIKVTPQAPPEIASRTGTVLQTNETQSLVQFDTNKWPSRIWVQSYYLFPEDTEFL